MLSVEERFLDGYRGRGGHFTAVALGGLMGRRSARRESAKRGARPVPRIWMVREPVRLPRYVTPEHFATIYQDALCPGRKTGLRINEILSFKKYDLNLEAGQLVTRWADNKGKRDEIVPLHDVVVKH